MQNSDPPGHRHTDVVRRPVDDIFWSWLATCLPYLIITLFTVLFYFPLVLPGMGNLREGDFYRYFVPFRVYASLQLHAGDLPFRTNALFGGYPIFQDPQFAILYPVNLLFGLLVPDMGNEAAIDAYMLANLLILSLAAVFFIRCAGISRLGAIVGACVICFNGFTPTHVDYLGMMQVQAMSLIAAGLLLLYARRGAIDYRLALGAGIALAMGNLAGHPQTMVYYHYAVAIGVAFLSLWLWKKTGAIKDGIRLAVAGASSFAFGIALAAIQLIPTAFLIAICARTKVSRAEVIWSPVDWPQLSMFLFPGFYQTLPWHLQWPPYYYKPGFGAELPVYSFTNLTEGYIPMGVFATILGLLGWFCYRKQWMVQVLGWGSLFLVACGMGGATPLYGWLCDFVPGFSLVRVSGRILIVFYAAWALLAALGAQALWQRATGITRSSRAAVMCLLFLVAIWAAWVAVGYRGSILDMWIRTFADYMVESINRDELKALQPSIFAALRKQVYFGVFFLVSAVLLFSLPIKRPRARTLLIVTVMCFELVIYNFGWKLALYLAPIDSAEAEELKAFPDEPQGRVLVGNYAYGAATNAAMYMDMQMANGYSVTADKWVMYLLPIASPPWQLGIQGVLCDLWNVSDINFPNRPVQARIGGYEVTLGDWGFSMIGSKPEPAVWESIELGRRQMSTSFTLDLHTTQPVKALHVIGFAGDAGSLPDGTEIGRVIARTRDSAHDTSVPIILGEDISDPLHPLPGESAANAMAHSPAPVAFQRYVPSEWSNKYRMYDGDVELETSSPVVSLEIQATAPWPVTLAITHVAALMEDGTPLIKEAFETEGFEKTESQRSLLYTVGRDEVPGFVRVMPVAVGGSYKKIPYVVFRLTNGEIDPWKNVLVDKREFDQEALQEMNAPDPDSFESTATITWEDDEHAVVRAEANQPGWVFLSYAWDAGWSARLNGEPVTIHRGSGAFMTIPIKAGVNEIVMSYRPQGLIIGSIISAIALVSLIGAWVVSNRRRKRLAVS